MNASSWETRPDTRTANSGSAPRPFAPDVRRRVLRRHFSPRRPSRRLDPPHPYRRCSGASIQAVGTRVRFPRRPRASRAGWNRKNGPAQRHGRDIHIRTRRRREPILARGHPRHVGAGGRYSHFSQTANLVVELSPKDPGPDTPPEDVETLNTLRGSVHSQRMNVALRKAQIALASYLAEAVSGFSPASVDTYELTEVDPSLPRVVYGCQVVRDLIYGIPPGWQPTLLHPNELMDGAVFRLSNYLASARSTIYDQQNHHPGRGAVSTSWH